MIHGIAAYESAIKFEEKCKRGIKRLPHGSWIFAAPV